MPKKPKKISVSTESSTDELAKKIEASAEEVVINIDKKSASIGAPEISTIEPDEAPKVDSADTAKKITITDEQSPEPQATAPELPVDEVELPEEVAETIEISAEEAIVEDPEQVQEIEEPEQFLDSEKSVGELAEAVDVNPENEFADAEITAAVEEIVAAETDEILEKEDRIKEELSETYKVNKPEAKQSKIKKFFGNRAVRRGLATGLVIILLAVVIVPGPRYAVLNLAGVRSGSTVTVLDSQTKLPLKNVNVQLQNKSLPTDQDGKVKFDDLKLGTSQLKIEKRGFETVDKEIVLGWGSNPLSPEGIKAVGSVFVFSVKDYLSDKPLSAAEATSGEASAKADAAGKINLVVDQFDGDVTVKIGAPGQREEEITFGASDKTERIVAMVPDKPSFFLSKRSGKYDVYSVDIDGKNEKLILGATGKERDDIDLMAHPTDNVAVLVSTRENHKNKSGYVLSGLFAITPGESPNRIAESERINLIDWDGKNLIFSETKEGQSAASSERSRIKSYNYDTGEVKELAKANYFNDILVFDGRVYYAPSSYAIEVDSVKFYSVKPDGTDKQTVFNEEVWSLLRTNYDSLSFTVQQSWYEIKRSSKSPSLMQTPPASQRNKVFRESPNKQNYMTTDDRDGKGVLLLTKTSGGEERVLASRSGLAQPVRWLNDNTVVYRVVSSQETADYALNIDGGESKKIVDVTNSGTGEGYRY